MSNGDKSIDYGVTADATGFVGAMDRAAESAKGAGARIQTQFESVGKAFEAVQSKLVLIAAVVGGGKFFKDAIDAANKLTGEQTSLAKRLGITGDQASALNTALGDIGSDSDTYIGAFDKFAKQLKTNEAGLNEMGLATRDSNGHLRDSQQLFTEATQLVGQYKPGLDQTTAAMTLFGKGVDDVMKLQKLNNDLLEEARRKNEELGLTMTQESVAASKQYKAAMNDVGDVLEAVKVQVGRAVMPAFTELATYFASSGPYVIGVFKGALTGLMLVFRSLQLVVKSVFDFIFEVINHAIDQFGNFSELMNRLLKGDFSGAAEMGAKIAERFKQGVANVGSAIKDNWQEATAKFGEDLDRMWGKGTAVAAPKGGGKTMGKFKDEKGDGKEKQPASQMKYYEAALEEEKRLATERDALHGMSKQEEQAYWQALLEKEKLTEGDRLEVQKRASAARIEVLREEAQQANQLGQLNLTAWQARQLAQLQLEEDQAQQRQQQGQITENQLLQQQIEFENRKQQIQRTAIEASLAAVDPQRDLVQVAQLNNQLEQLEAEHQRRIAQIRGQIALQSANQQRKIWDDLGGRMSSLWDQGVNAMMNGTLRWSNAVRAVGAQLGGWFLNSVVKPRVTAWLFGENAQTAATVTGTAARTAAEATASATSIATWAMTAVKNIMTNAWAAMAAAWQAVVGIPYVGPVLAVAAAAAAFAGVSALAGKVASAEGGYDIPAGVNPMTQLHEKEMVLPARHADVIRSMADNKGFAGQAAGPITFAPKMTPLKGNFFVVHRDDLVTALQGARRDGAKF